jgi:hypothetical protein
MMISNKTISTPPSPLFQEGEQYKNPPLAMLASRPVGRGGWGVFSIKIYPVLYDIKLLRKIGVL